MDVDEEIDRLYALPPDRFTAERDALARRLRKEGAREDADRAKMLRKPSVAAGTVNRVVREHPDDVRALLASVDELREAQAQALEGDAARFREAAETHRMALDRLAAHGAVTLEEAGGAGATVADRVRETFQAAAQDPAARDDLAAGRLTRELAPGGIDALGLAGAVPVERDATRARRTRSGTSGEGGAAKGGGKAAATGGGEAGAKDRGKAAARGGGEAGAKDRGKAAARGADAPAPRPPAGERRRARDAARAAEQRAESARRRLARAQEAAARARDALEEAQAAVAVAEQEAGATSARDRELSGAG